MCNKLNYLHEFIYAYELRLWPSEVEWMYSNWTELQMFAWTKHAVLKDMHVHPNKTWNDGGGRCIGSVKWVGEKPMLTLPLVVSVLAQSFQGKVGTKLVVSCKY